MTDMSYPSVQLVSLGNWKCPRGCVGSTFFTYGVKNNVQISCINTCGMCGSFEGWRTDDDGSKIQLSEVSDTNDSRDE